MSVRAYHIKKIKIASQSTFNCWHDADVLDLASTNNTNSDGGGIVSFDVALLKEYLENDFIDDNSEVQNDLKERIEQIIRDANGDDFVDYFCY